MFHSADYSRESLNSSNLTTKNAYTTPVWDSVFESRKTLDTSYQECLNIDLSFSGVIIQLEKGRLKMKFTYETPSLTDIRNFQYIALTQSGVNEVPSNPENSCVDASCTAQSDGHDSYDLKVSWNDEAGTDVSLYTVNVHLDPANEDYALTNATIPLMFRKETVFAVVLTATGILANNHESLA
jgi:hypothetical protein